MGRTIIILCALVLAVLCRAQDYGLAKAKKVNHWAALSVELSLERGPALYQMGWQVRTSNGMDYYSRAGLGFSRGRQSVNLFPACFYVDITKQPARWRFPVILDGVLWRATGWKAGASAEIYFKDFFVQPYIYITGHFEKYKDERE